jgi:arylformamidase
MKFYDITMTITNTMTLWPGDPPVRLERVISIEAGDPCNVTGISMGAHTGTHIDAPCHYIDGGGGADAIRPDVLIGPCLVVEPGSEKSLIEAGHLEGIDIREHTRLLFKTKNSGHLHEGGGRFYENFTSLGMSAARFLVDRGIILVGIDYLSIESYHAPLERPVHKHLLRNNIAVLEGLDLSSVSPGPYELICLPLKLAGADGSPARVVLRQPE